MDINKTQKLATFKIINFNLCHKKYYKKITALLYCWISIVEE